MMWHFFCGSDYGRGGTGDPKSRRSGDDFATATARAMVSGPVQFVHMYRHTGIESGQASAVLHHLHQAFGYTMMMLDPNGGGLGVRDDLRKPIQDTGAEKFAVTPIITEWDEGLAGVGNPILVLFKRGEPIMDRCGLIFPGESCLINRAHETFRTGLLRGEIQAPPAWDGWPRGSRVTANVDAMRLWLNEREGMNPGERAAAELDLGFLQLVQVAQKADKDGKPLLDKYGQYTWSSRRKKDAAYALVYTYFAIHLWRTLMALDEDSAPSGDFAVGAQEV